MLAHNPNPPKGNLGRTAATAVMLLTLVCAASPAAAQSYSILHTFQGGTDGQFPSGQLVQGPKGSVYGVVLNGGANGTGQVYQLSKNRDGTWSKTSIHDFDQFCCGEFLFPTGNLIGDSNGNLFGTVQGGANGAGALFELSPPAKKGQSWTLTDLYDYPTIWHQGSAGTGPSAILFDNLGNLFGLYEFGSVQAGCPNSGCGILYELSPGGGQWTEQTLHTFGLKRKDQFDVPYNLVRNKAGQLFGIVTAGSAGYGAVWQATHANNGTWKVTDIHDFCLVKDQYGNCTDGQQPGGGLALDRQGNLYGTTFTGGPELIQDDQPKIGGAGTVFRLMKGGWGYQLLRTFYPDFSQDGSGVYDGWWPAQTLTVDTSGNVFGTTSSGGYESSDHAVATGTVFELAAGSWAESNLHTFGPLNEQGTDLRNSSTPILVQSGNLFGAALYDASANNGGIYEIVP